MKLLMKNYLLTDIKKKFEKYRSLITELAREQGKKVDLLLCNIHHQVNCGRRDMFSPSAVFLQMCPKRRAEGCTVRETT